MNTKKLVGIFVLLAFCTLSIELSAELVLDIGGTNSSVYPATWSGLYSAVTNANINSISQDVTIRVSSFDGSGNPVSYIRQTTNVTTEPLVVNCATGYKITIEGGYNYNFTATSGKTTIDGNMKTEGNSPDWTLPNSYGSIDTATATNAVRARVFTLVGSGMIVLKNLVLTGGGRRLGERTDNVYGAIMYANTKVRLTNLTVKNGCNDKTGDLGGGIYLGNNCGGSILESLIVEHNWCNQGWGGGIMASITNKVLISQCIFHANRVLDASRGAHIAKDNSGALIIWNCLFYDAYSTTNALKDMNTTGGQPVHIVNCTVVNNPENGYYQDRIASNVRIRNCIFSDNGTSGQGINFANWTMAVGYTVVDDNPILGTFTNEGNISTNVVSFKDQTNRDYRLISENTSVIDTGGYLRDASVTFNGQSQSSSVKFVDVDNSGAAYQPLTDIIVKIVSGPQPSNIDYENHFIYTSDLTGSPSLRGDSIDMGAYQYPPASGTVIYFK